MVPQNFNLNRGRWKRLENKWAEALKKVPPSKVEVEIRPVYGDPTKPLRPTGFKGEYYIDGKPTPIDLPNEAQ